MSHMEAVMQYLVYQKGVIVYEHDTLITGI